MILKELVDRSLFSSVSGNCDSLVTGLSHDSRLFKRGHLFFAIKGSKFDGHKYLPGICATAAGVVVEDPSQVPKGFAGGVLVTPHPRELLAPIAAKFFNYPSDQVYLVGVTGTNGKTTTTYMLEALLGGGVIGTVDCHFEAIKKPATHTTPDPIVIQSLMREWIDLGARSVAMEVTSHALSLNRVEALHFDAAIFTNLTRDHLDFHQTMERYAQAKESFFKGLLDSSPKKNKRAVVNADDPYHTQMLPRSTPFWTFGFGPSDIQVTQADFSLDGTNIEANTPVGKFKGHLQMLGRHNVSNALGALGVAFHYGISPDQASQKIENLVGVAGRLQKVRGGNKLGLHVFVDYAHTDDGLGRVLDFLKETRDTFDTSARIITVFGCGGDRDKGKRPLMMQAALSRSDFVIVTSDNPRTEDPQAIINDVISGVSPSSKFAVDADRRGAIQLSIEKAKRGDIILIAGKGHENYQIIGEIKYPFDDYKTAEELLSK